MTDRAIIASLLLCLAPGSVVLAAEAAAPVAASPPAASRAPRASAEARNLAGMWLLAEEPVARRETLKPEFSARFMPATSGGPVASAGVAESARQCVPSALFGAAYGYPLRIIQTATQITLLSEENNRVHRIYLDRDFPEKLVPSYAGFTVGRWEGNTLVAETRGLRFAAGSAALPDYRVVERIRRSADGQALEQDVSVQSSAYATPATRSYRYMARPDLRWQPGVCEEQPMPFSKDLP